MSLTLYAHPFSSYCQKVLIPLYESATPFEYRVLGQDEAASAEHRALWPLQKFPVLVDKGRTLFEASIIVEHLDREYPAADRLIPDDRRAALEVRMLDRFFDGYVMTPMQKIVGDVLRSPDLRDPHGVAEAHGLLDTAYRWLEERMRGRTWSCDDAFTLADCAAAPSLFYADWVHPIDASLASLRAYRQRLLARPSFARAVDEARPYRPLFPLGAPERD
jgi:glutathione S-transferase